MTHADMLFVVAIAGCILITLSLIAGWIEFRSFAMLLLYIADMAVFGVALWLEGRDAR
jgi:ABC-type uncharacterized transport system permease subunit